MEGWRGAGEYGAAGLSEGTPCGTYAAIANAIYNAVGIRIKHIPFKPEKILEKLAEKAAAERGEK
jgi:CO/xanthine dehydrogenase Mo-binding subunit